MTLAHAAFEAATNIVPQRPASWDRAEQASTSLLLPRLQARWRCSEEVLAHLSCAARRRPLLRGPRLQLREQGVRQRGAMREHGRQHRRSDDQQQRRQQPLAAEQGRGGVPEALLRRGHASTAVGVGIDAATPALRSSR